MSTLSTHVLDVALGRPASGIRVELEHDGGRLDEGITDGDGRVRELGANGGPLRAGTYRLTFHVGAYFSSAARDTFYERITVEFTLSGRPEHYHVPLLLSPFGYTTYRGS